MRQRYPRLAIAVAGMMLVVGWLALAHHHDSSTADQCLLCSMLSHGVATTSGVGRSAAIFNLVKIVNLPENHLLHSYLFQPIQPRAPPSSAKVFV